MKTIMNVEELVSIEQLRQFLDGTQAVAFIVESDRNAIYRWFQSALAKFAYLRLSRPDKGVVVRYLMRISGYSRQQITRLIKQFRDNGRLIRHQKTQNGFQQKYTREDVSLLAELDELHGTLSGPATKKLCERARKLFNQVEYERLAGISVAHLYNLRGSQGYQGQRWNYEKTKPTISTIGQRRKPFHDGKPGHIRIDTVHQGDLDKEKGVYHINAVDEVTQFEVIFTVEKISEHYLIPVLAELLDVFPFILIGFHSDNGSEYINSRVAKLLEKLFIEFTKSRPRHSNDNALAECKNGAIVRKILGYSHIPQQWANEVNEFNKVYVVPYINYHRPCFYPDIIVDDKGKERKKYRYESMMTPYEKFKSLPNSETYLKKGLSFEELDKIAMKTTDSEAARRLQRARIKLFQTIDGQRMVG
jgi:hypothetical protein